MDEFFSGNEQNNIEESPKSNEGFAQEVDVKRAAAGQTDAQEKSTFRSEVFEWLDVIITAIIAVVIIFSLIFRVATIDGPSMENTFFTGDKVIITNFLYTPKVNDVVVVSRNADNSIQTASDEPIIKRVIATEGQTVDIDFIEGIVYVDGKALEEPYAKTATNRKDDIDFPVTVPKGCIFVLGDNRNESLDSRSSSIGNEGMIDTRYVIGRAVLRIFPLDSFGKVQ